MTTPAPWVYGWNAPGFLPDAELNECATWQGARDSLIWELERTDCETPQDEADADSAIAELRAATPETEITTRVVRGQVLWIARGDTPFDRALVDDEPKSPLTAVQRSQMREDGADAFAHDYARRSNPYDGLQTRTAAFVERAAEWYAGYDAAQAAAGGPNLNQRRIEAVEAPRATPALRAWVGCLASYNSGQLHGGWFDVSTDSDENAAHIASVLRSSPHPNVTRRDPETGAEYATAEESYVADYDNAPAALARFLGEYPSAERLASAAMIVEGVAAQFSDADEAAAVVDEMLDGVCDAQLESIAENVDDWISDHFAGRGDATLADWCADFLDETGFFQFDDESKDSDRLATIARYFDFESYARDMQLGGEISAARVNGSVLVFWNR